MTRRDDAVSFIKKSTLIHKDKFNYSLVEYVNSRTKVKIKCNSCEIILEQAPSDHLRYNNCSNCIKINSIGIFIKKSKEIYKDKFDYSLITNVIGTNVKISLICNDCKTTFNQFISNHLQGTFSCKVCWKKDKSLTKESFIERCKKIHNDNFDYSLVEFTNTNDKIKLKCNKCGIIFEQSAGGHLYHQHKCLNCTHNDQRKSKEDFIKDSRKIHGDKYDYSLTEYINAYTLVSITCLTCNHIFEQIPRTHTSLKCGCPFCNFSKGEVICEKILKENKNVSKIIPQFKLKDCKQKFSLPFDFKVVLSNNKFFLIEYQGKQHYEAIPFFGGEESFVKQQKRDNIKMEYCKKNDIKLLIIKYTETEIRSIINDYIKTFY